MIDLGSAVARLRLDTGEFDSSLNKSKNTLASAGKAIGKGFAVMSAAAVTGMVAIGKSSVEAGMQFDKSMAQVAATMGVTVDEIQNLRDFALEMGAKTAFSASEAADALNYMALAGYDAQTSMAMLPNVLNLAAAGGIDLARASDMITDSQSALGLTLDETTELVDKMARASSKSNTSVEQLGEAILTVGGTAKMMRGGTTELATALGILADNGIKGSEGGTALRNILLSLTTPTKEAQDALIKFGGAEKLVYDEAGNMRSLNDILSDLNDITKDMTQQERIDLLGKLFNKRDLKSAEALLANYGERWEELSGAIDDAQGAAQKMADTQLDNLTGDITLFNSALEGAKITLSDKLTPALRTFVQFGTKEIGKLDKAFKEGGIEGFSYQLGKSLGSAANMILSKVPTFVSAAGKLISSLVSTIGTTLSRNFPKLLRYAIKTLKDIAQGIGKAIPDIMGGIGEMIGNVITNIPNILELAWNIVVNLGKGILQGIPKIAEGIWNGLVGLFTGPLSKEAQEANEYMEDLKLKLEEIGMSSEEMYDKLEGADREAGMAEYWLGVFEDLYQKTDLTKTEQQKLNDAIEYLNKNVLPETSQIVKDEAGNWVADTEAIYNNIQALKDRKIAEIYLEKANGELEKMVELELQIGQKSEALNSLEDKAASLSPKVDEAKNSVELLADAFADWTEEARKSNVNADVAFATWEQGSESMRRLAESVGITESNFTSWSNVMGTLRLTHQSLQNELDRTNKSISLVKGQLYALNMAHGVVENSVDKYMNKSAEWRAKSEDDMNAVADSAESNAPKVRRAIETMIEDMDISELAGRSGEDGGSAYTNGLAGSINKGKKDVLAQISQLMSEISASTSNPLGRISGIISGFNSISHGSYASGLDYVPRTMQVTVHRGERILTQEENSKYDKRNPIDVITYRDDTAISKLGSKLDKILDAIDKIDQMQMVVDGKKLVGAIRREMNMQLAEEYDLG